MVLYTCPQRQQDWLKKNFGIAQDEMSTYLSTYSMIYDLLGIDNVQSDGWYFMKKCWSSITHSYIDKKRFQRMVNRLLYLKEECLQLEFYELYYNFSIVIGYIEEVIRKYNEEYLEDYIDDQVRSLLIETGITKKESGPELLF